MHVGSASSHDHHWVNTVVRCHYCEMHLSCRDTPVCVLELVKCSIQMEGWLLKIAIANFWFFLAGSSSVYSLSWSSSITLRSHGLLSLPCLPAHVSYWKDFYHVIISEATSPLHSLSLTLIFPISWDMFIPQIVSQTEFLNFSSESLLCCVLCSH